MAVPSDLRRGIPASEPRRLRHAARRTAVVRGLLALALLAAFALTLLTTRRYDVRHAPLVPSGTTGVVVLDLSASIYEADFGATIRKMARTGERAGLVVFSDTAYELYPPGTPGRELVPLLRFFRPDPTSATGVKVSPWEDLRAGTQISQGVKVARAALLRDHAAHGSILVVSDLEILPDEAARLAAQVQQLRDDGIRLRFLPVHPSAEKRALIARIVGSSSFLRETGTQGALEAPDTASVGLAAPWLFLAAAGLIVLLLTANEWLLARLRVRRR